MSPEFAMCWWSSIIHHPSTCLSFPHPFPIFPSFFTFSSAADPTFEVLNLTPPLLQALTVASNALASAKEAQPEGWVVGTSLELVGYSMSLDPKDPQEYNRNHWVTQYYHIRFVLVSHGIKLAESRDLWQCWYLRGCRGFFFFIQEPLGQLAKLQCSEAFSNLFYVARMPLILNTPRHRWLFGHGPTAGNCGVFRWEDVRCKKYLPDDFSWGFQMPS